MKRVDLVGALTGQGCELIRHGDNHDWYRNPRHREIKESLAKHILKKLESQLPAHP